ncbi:ubiquitin-like protein 4A [Anthonomus grandis grandis]|uniref:ubiquitin-like protein 4A n=1 Tax=Anthonomus grandis grandis TaxID=2921223 RepID=UPI0021652109|nr:ubiquitin-like protein 4A [Anthonomus grandis grandis]
MQIIIKCLKGGSTSAEVDQGTSILDVKRKVEKDLKIPINQQTLLVLGSPLQENKTVGDYPKIKEGTKLYVVIKKPESFQMVLTKFLRRAYSEDQTRLIFDEFMRNFKKNINSLSLDDLEKLATTCLSE